MQTLKGEGVDGGTPTGPKTLHLNFLPHISGQAALSSPEKESHGEAPSPPTPKLSLVLGVWD